MQDTLLTVLIHILEAHYCALASMLAMLVFMKTIKISGRRVRVGFLFAILSVITIVFTDSFVIYYMSLPSPCFIQVALRALGYIVRPLVALFIFLVVIRREKKINFVLIVVRKMGLKTITM